MLDRFMNRAMQLMAQREPFATACVVRFESPISGKPGDRAIVFPDGKIWGWIGGGCAQPVVIKEALKALSDGQPRLVRISPEATAEDGIVSYAMTCHSGGTLDIYIEPVLPKPHIVIFGRSPIAQTLAQLASAIQYKISVVCPDADCEQFPGAELRKDWDVAELGIDRETFIVVSTQGEGDEEAVQQAATSAAEYVAFVASKIKAQKLLDSIHEAGVPSDRISRIRTPAGLDIHAASPEEIAVSILAEIIQTKGGRAHRVTDAGLAALRENAALPVLGKEALDPVCGMHVNVAGAKYKSEHKGETIFFCGLGCKRAYDLTPEKYILPERENVTQR